MGNLDHVFITSNQLLEQSGKHHDVKGFRRNRSRPTKTRDDLPFNLELSNF